jgi:hypothetical protein
MKSVTIRSTAAAVVLVCAGAASAQSLADVARQEEARRKTITTSGRVYTNDTLRPSPASTGQVPAPPPVPSRPAAESPVPSADAPTATDPVAPGEAPRTEADWRAAVTSEREALSRAQIFADALQSRINVLAADFVNRDDPAQRNVVAAEREKALAELDRVDQEIQQHEEAIIAIQEEARRAGVPAGWVR